MFCFVFIRSISEPGADSRLAVTIVCIALAAIGFVPRHKLRQEKAVLANHSGDINRSAVESAALRLHREWEWLLRTSHPREVQLTRKGKRTLVRNSLSFLLIAGMLVLCLIGNSRLLHKQHGAEAGRLLRPCCQFSATRLD